MGMSTPRMPKARKAKFAPSAPAAGPDWSYEGLLRGGAAAPAPTSYTGGEFAMSDAPAGPAADEGPGFLEAGARGIKQGVTLGFGDEATGALESLFTDKTYEQARDEARANDAAARKAHPWGFGIGEAIGGMAVPGLGVGGGLVKGAGLAAAAARGAIAGGVQGAVSGLGNSEASTVGGAVGDATKGGIMGAGLGAILGGVSNKLVKGAEGRSDERLVQEITGGRATAAGKKVYQNEPLAVETARKFGLDKAGDREAMTAATSAARQDVGSKIGDAYKSVDESFIGVKKSDVLSGLDDVKAKYDSPAQAGLRKQVDALKKEVESSWEGTHVPLEKVNRFQQDIAKVGFASPEISPKAAIQLRRDVAGAIGDALDNRVDEISKIAEHVKAPVGGGNATMVAQPGTTEQMLTAADKLKDLKALNRDYHGLMMINKINEEMAGVPTANRAAGGLRNALGNAVDMGLLFHNPLAYGAKKILGPVAKGAVNGADELLARLGRAARMGNATSSLIQDAIEAGIPKSAIAAAVAGTSDRK